MDIKELENTIGLCLDFIDLSNDLETVNFFQMVGSG